MKKKISFLFLFLLISYGIARFYYHEMDGFILSNITSVHIFPQEGEVKPLTIDEKIELDNVFDQPYDYLGKGAQSYVFASRNGNYVIKFIKQKHFDLATWIKYLPPLPAVVKFREEKKIKKRGDLEVFMQSCYTAFENLKEETGLIFLHFKQTSNLKKHLVIYDKIGKKHVIDLDQFQFYIQRQAQMLSKTLLEYKEENNITSAQDLIDQIFEMLTSEFLKGIVDNDDAIVQNTGVIKNKPIHIDIGQFAFDEKIKNEQFYKQKLFSKISRLKEWLHLYYPELEAYADKKLNGTQ